MYLTFKIFTYIQLDLCQVRLSGVQRLMALLKIIFSVALGVVLDPPEENGVTAAARMILFKQII